MNESLFTPVRKNDCSSCSTTPTCFLYVNDHFSHYSWVSIVKCYDQGIEFRFSVAAETVLFSASARPFVRSSHGYRKPWPLKQGRLTRGPPGCVMRPAATFANYVYTTKNAQQFRRLSIQLVVILHMRPLEPAYNNCSSPLPTWLDTSPLG